MRVSKNFTFEASHILPKHPGKCARLHGHSWGLKVSLDGRINAETGFVLDFYDLSLLVNTFVISKLDHTHLGQGVLYDTAGQIVPGGKPFLDTVFDHSFYPSSENLVIAIADILDSEIIKEWGHEDIRLAKVELSETCTSSAVWRRKDAELG